MKDKPIFQGDRLVIIEFKKVVVLKIMLKNHCIKNVCLKYKQLMTFVLDYFLTTSLHLLKCQNMFKMHFNINTKYQTMNYTIQFRMYLLFVILDCVFEPFIYLINLNK